jgi:hypothetical protein
MISYLKNLSTCCIFFPPPAPLDFLKEALKDKIHYTVPQGNTGFRIPYTISKAVSPAPLEEEEGEISLKKNLIVRVLYSHGNSDSLYFIQDRVTQIANILCYSLSHEYNVEIIVLAWTYPTFPGFIDSKATLTALHLQQCASQVWEELNTVPTQSFPPNSQVELIEVALGYSVGTYPACFLSTLPAFSPDIVYLLSPFSTLPAGNNGKYQLTQRFTGALLDNVELIRWNRKPSLVHAVYATSDEVLPFDHNSEITLNHHVTYSTVPGNHSTLTTDEGLRLGLSNLIDMVVELVENPRIPNSNVVVLREEEDGGRPPYHHHHLL